MTPARRARAALVVAAGLAAATLRPEPPPVPCAGPEPAGEREGFTERVRCGAGGSGEGLRGPVRLLFGAPLDANRAPARALEALPGIGPGRARALVEARALKPLCRPADLERAHGVGPALRRRIEPFVRTGGEGCDGEPVAPFVYGHP